MAAFTAPAIVLAPLFGILADLHGRRWLLVFGLALFGLAGAAAAFAPTYEWVLVCAPSRASARARCCRSPSC